MANTASARKRIRQTAKRTARNQARKSRMRTFVKKVEAAIAGGYAIECDVQPSADGEAMVFHDDALPRLTGAPGLVSDHPASVLAGMKLTGTAEGIPTLAEILALVAGRTPLLMTVTPRAGEAQPLPPDTRHAVLVQAVARARGLGPILAAAALD